MEGEEEEQKELAKDGEKGEGETGRDGKTDATCGSHTLARVQCN